MKCKNCGETTKNKKFCSLSCAAKYIHKLKQEKYFENVLKHKEFVEFRGNTGTNPGRKVKNYLIKYYGHKCEICGNTEWMGKPIPLVLDHIDGNAGNWKLNNLRLVCGNCDMQLPTYKSKNRGNSTRKFNVRLLK